MVHDSIYGYGMCVFEWPCINEIFLGKASSSELISLIRLTNSPSKWGPQVKWKGNADTSWHLIKWSSGDFQALSISFIHSNGIRLVIFWFNDHSFDSTTFIWHSLNCYQCGMAILACASPGGNPSHGVRTNSLRENGQFALLGKAWSTENHFEPSPRSKMDGIEVAVHGIGFTTFSLFNVVMPLFLSNPNDIPHYSWYIPLLSHSPNIKFPHCMVPNMYEPPTKPWFIGFFQ